MTEKIKESQSSLSRRTFSGFLIMAGAVAVGLSKTFKGSSLEDKESLLNRWDSRFSKRKYQSYVQDLKARGFIPFQHSLHGVTVENTFKDDQILTRRMGFSGGIWIHQKKNRAIKVYSPFAETSNGEKGRFHPMLFGYISRKQAYRGFFRKEKAAYQKLQAIESSFIPKNLRFNEKQVSLEMEYLGEDFCAKNNRNKSATLSETDLEQIVSMFREYQNVGIFKQNTFSSNLFRRDDGTLVATDFKMWTPRTESHLEHQIRMVFFNLGALHPKLPQRLRSTFSDFSEELVDRYYAQYEKMLNESQKVLV
ncbi:MAG: hypothetical protein KDD61_14410 [Bdellovibrionales bacterium]|nr:hypothetical protein [Bdellovibrionales bacterium]